jgi:NhaP-type Na+/H+ and K+/H+ antiporters with a unique C-terminal domain
MIVITVGLLLLLSTMASKLTERSGIPVLLVFLSIGMLAGSEGPGGIHFENATIANLFGTFALSYILFSGGLGTHWRSVRPVLWRSTVLSTLGVAVTAGLVGLFSVFILSIPLLEALLIGAIVSSTDAAAVFSVLRSRGVMLKGNLKALLEMESGSNDPMAVFLTMSLMRLLMEPIASWLQILPSFFINMTLGIAAGIVLGKVAVLVLDGIHLQHESLYPGPEHEPCPHCVRS